MNKMILLIDNYDSVTFNLKRYLQQLAQEVCVVRNDDMALDRAVEECDAILISPGPQAPEQAGRCIEVIQENAELKPMLGICLGHQAIVQAFGGVVQRALKPLHGKALPINLDPVSLLFESIGSPAYFARYHSLVAASELPGCLRKIAVSDQGEVMAVRHERLPIFGVQFHPESVLSADGFQLLANFLRLSGLKCPRDFFCKTELDTSIENIRRLQLSKENLSSGDTYFEEEESLQIPPTPLPHQVLRS